MAQYQIAWRSARPPCRQQRPLARGTVASIHRQTTAVPQSGLRDQNQSLSHRSAPPCDEFMFQARKFSLMGMRSVDCTASSIKNEIRDRIAFQPYYDSLRTIICGSSFCKSRSKEVSYELIPTIPMTSSGTSLDVNDVSQKTLKPTVALPCQGWR